MVTTESSVTSARVRRTPLSASPVPVAPALALALATAPPFLPLALGWESGFCWAALALALAFCWALRRSCAERVEAIQPVEPLNSSPCSNRQPERATTLPGVTVAEPFQIWGSLSVSPKRIRTPTSAAVEIDTKTERTAKAIAVGKESVFIVSFDGGRGTVGSGDCTRCAARLKLWGHF